MKKLKQLGKRILSCLLIATMLVTGLPKYAVEVIAAEGAAEEEEEEDICGPVIDPVTGSVRYHCIYFGKQGSNEMKWRVLSVNEKELFVVAERAVAYQEFGFLGGYSPQWKDSSLRTWLNDTFIKETFTEKEQAAIISKSDGGGDSPDRVSLLSVTEVENDFFGFTWDDKVHKNSRILMTDTGKAVSWWLKDGRVVGETGYIYSEKEGEYAVRPVIHINRNDKESWQDAGIIDSLEPQTDRQMPENPVIDEKNKTVIWDCVYFGNYFQKEGTVREPIKWRVLSVKGDEAYLIADQNLASEPYHSGESIQDEESLRWDQCSLRNWLNYSGISLNFLGGFTGLAFGKEEQLGIIRNENGDMVSLLSEDELHKPEYGLVPESESARGGCARTAENTPYVRRTNSWWLRGGNDGGGKAVLCG